MPEGDTIHQLATRLAPVLTGRVVEAFTAHRIPDDAARSVIGHRVVAVEARGKNLLVRFDDARALLVHLRMHGRVTLERPRSAYWTGPRAAGPPEMRLAVEGAAIVGRHLPVCRLLSATAERRAPALARLGPDLLGDALDEPEVLRRFRARSRTVPDREVADALLDQSVAAGIGNVYKSEVLFLEGVHPSTPAAALADDAVLALYRRARSLLLRNLRGGPRTTRTALRGPRLWVYGRGGRPCLRCDEPIVRVVTGPDAGRSTYFCRRCQPREVRAP